MEIDDIADQVHAGLAGDACIDVVHGTPDGPGVDSADTASAEAPAPIRKAGPQRRGPGMSAAAGYHRDPPS
jgi:hypothetical protein